MKQRIVGLGFLALSACTFTTATRTGGSPSSSSPSSPPPPVVAGDVPTQTERPGGPLSRDKRTCDAANDHCLRDGTWFLEVVRAGRPDLTLVYEAHGRWWDWWSGGEVTGGLAHRTRAARPDELKVGDTVLWFRSGIDFVPDSEHRAYGTWRMGTIHSIDLENRTFEHGNGSTDMPIDFVRVIVETR